MCCPGDSWLCWGHRHPWHQARESGLCLVDAGPRAAGSRYQLDRQRREDYVLEGSILSLHLTTVSGTGVDSLGGARPGKRGGDTGSALCCCVWRPASLAHRDHWAGSVVLSLGPAKG